MRRILCLLALLLSCCLMAGCEDTDAEPTGASVPTATGETLVQAPETQPESQPETYPAAQVNTLVLRDSDPGLQQDFVILAVSQDAPFLAQNVQINSKGADALAQWLMSEAGRELAGDFGRDAYGQAVYRLSEETQCYTGTVARATYTTATVRLAVEESLVSSGLTDVLIPAFENASGYTVELRTGTATAACSAVRNGYADLALTLSGEGAEALAEEGFLRQVDGLAELQPHFLSMPHLLCGPADDPAGVRQCATVEKAFAAIAAGRYTFVSRADNSYVHTLEQKFWPNNTEFGSWYIRANLEMGPCLVLNDIQGGYILTDNLTWLIYTAAEGII